MPEEKSLFHNTQKQMKVRSSSKQPAMLVYKYNKHALQHNYYSLASLDL